MHSIGFDNRKSLRRFSSSLLALPRSAAAMVQGTLATLESLAETSGLSISHSRRTVILETFLLSPHRLCVTSGRIADRACCCALRPDYAENANAFDLILTIATCFGNISLVPCSSTLVCISYATRLSLALAQLAKKAMPRHSHT